MADRVSSAEAAPTRPAVGDELELRIESLAFGGAGVARSNGYVVFVEGAFPGDLVQARVHHRKRSYAQARSIALLEPGPGRVAPLANHPGAPWQEISYELQLEIKQHQVADALRRIGHLDGFELEAIVAADEPWRYRNKLEYSFGTGSAGELTLGFHAPGSWERIDHIDDCLLASEAGNEARRAVLDWARARELKALDRRGRTGFLRNLVVREGRRSGQIQLRLITTDGELDGESLAAATGVHSLLWTRTDAVAESSSGGRTELIAGSYSFDERLCGLELAISPEAFFQTNTEMAERLYGLVAEACDLHGWERGFDLFCGTGTIGLSLARRAGHVFGVEIVPRAVADAIENAKRNDITNASFFAGDVRLSMRELRERAGRPDVVIIDPPRAGLSQKIVRRIIETSPKRIVYVSCNPTTLAPNAAQLGEAGWRLERVTPLDMFPQTPHIECVALLTR